VVLCCRENGSQQFYPRRQQYLWRLQPVKLEQDNRLSVPSAMSSCPLLLAVWAVAHRPLFPQHTRAVLTLRPRSPVSPIPQPFVRLHLPPQRFPSSNQGLAQRISARVHNVQRPSHVALRHGMGSSRAPAARNAARRVGGEQTRALARNTYRWRWDRSTKQPGFPSPTATARAPWRPCDPYPRPLPPPIPPFPPQRVEPCEHGAEALAQASAGPSVAYVAFVWAGAPPRVAQRQRGMGSMSTGAGACGQRCRLPEAAGV
jgi:hypothetical protein